MLMLPSELETRLQDIITRCLLDMPEGTITQSMVVHAVATAATDACQLGLDAARAAMKSNRILWRDDPELDRGPHPVLP
jgi:hypothetical protein